MPPPSLKKLGKRPELHDIHRLDMPETTLSHPPGIITPAHQKRVLPSRSRRGGPGIGNCGVDQLIIDTEKRTRDAKPVIPPTHAFFLTTHSKAVPPPPDASASDGEAAGSYFDKPEVKAAYLAQRAIQVPEFAPLPDDAVGGRLRARAEEEGPETSDAAYLLRHRKYETFEKRQRRREKEKLVHEQYKLKERIEQLKGMDSTAFGGGGEARRIEMLGVAEGLEKRYAVLLPPEPRRAPKQNENKRRKSVGARGGTTTGDDGDADTDEEVAEVSGVDVPHPAHIGSRSQKANRQNLRLGPQTPVSRTPAVSVALPSSVPPSSAPPPPPPQHTYIAPTAPDTPSSRLSVSRKRDASGRFLTLQEQTAHTPVSTGRVSPESSNVVPDAPEVAPPRKRQRVESQAKRTHTPDPVQTSVLLQIAMRKAAQPNARQTGRTTLAFGFRVPFEVDDATHYELPEWLVTQAELEHLHEVRARSATRSASPNPTGLAPNGVESKHVVVTAVPAAAPALVNGISDGAPAAPALLTSSLREDNQTEDIVLNTT